MWDVFGLFLIVSCASRPTAAIRQYYAVDACSQGKPSQVFVPPEHGFVFRFDRNHKTSGPNFNFTVLPEIYDCNITFEGFGPMMAIHWRNEFHVTDRDHHSAGARRADCPLAFVSVSRDFGKSGDRLYTMCGLSVVPRGRNFEVSGKFLTIRVFANFTRPAVVLDPGSSQSGDTATIEDFGWNGTNSSTVTMEATPTFRPVVLDNPNRPEVLFTADITSFIPGCENAKNKYLKCIQSRRCLDKSLKCDVFFSPNCISASFQRDVSDMISGPPAYCGVPPTRPTTTTTTHAATTTTTTTTTTTPSPSPPTTTMAPEPEPNLIPVWITLSILAALAALWWCFWRPGYLPWRCARARNLGCCRGAGCCSPKGGGCSVCSCCSAGSTSGGPKSTNVATTEPGTLGKGVNNGTLGNEVSRIPNGGNLDWIKFANEDGSHLREQR